MAAVKQGDRVQIHYTGRLTDGTVFDSSEGHDPLEFEAGSKELIPGVSLAVVGMEEGDARTVSVPPAEAYGPHRPELQQEVPISELPEDVKQGDMLRASAGEEEIRVWVKEMGDETAVVDANHPLAGEILEFDIKLVAVVAGE